MRLSTTQQEFTVCVARLINYATSIGVQLTMGDAYRDPRVHGEYGVRKSYSASHSVHKKRLAIDLNLFVDGNYITTGNHQKYIMLGKEWEKTHPLARWGGRFGDANHFSFDYQGRS